MRCMNLNLSDILGSLLAGSRETGGYLFLTISDDFFFIRPTIAISSDVTFILGIVVDFALGVTIAIVPPQHHGMYRFHPYFSHYGQHYTRML